MEVLGSDGPGVPASRPARAVGAALALLLVGQLAAVTLGRPDLSEAARLVALKEGYGDRTDGDRAVIGFQLQNRGDREVQVLAAGRDGPGLELVDVVASGEPVGFRAAGAGPALMPAFRLAPEGVVVLTLVYQVPDCTLVPADGFPVTLLVRAGGAEGVVEVPLPRYPAEREGAAPGEEEEWQTALVRDLCGA